jgi:hypothetical protein
VKIDFGQVQFPEEEISSCGSTEPTVLYSAFLPSVIEINNINNKQPGGPAPSAAPPAPSQDSPAPNAELSDLQEQMQAHDGDPSWITSEAGKAVIEKMAKISSQLLAQVSQTPSAASMVTGGVKTLSFPWNYGQGGTVLTSTPDNGTIKLSVSLSKQND